MGWERTLAGWAWRSADQALQFTGDTGQEIISGGSEPTDTYNTPGQSPIGAIAGASPAPAAPAGGTISTDLSSAVDQFYARIGASHGDTSVAPTLSEDQILQGYQQQGFDPNNPSVLQAARLAAQMDASQQGQFLVDTGRAFASDSKYAAPTGSYYTAVEQFGLGQVHFGGGGGSTASAADNSLSGPAGRAIAQNNIQTSGDTGNREYQYVNGVFDYRNGVIADPASGNVYYDPKATNVPGSPTWLVSAQRSWDGQKIASWRSELYKLGYVSSKKGGWDAELIGATQKFYANKYLNGNIPVAAGKPGGGGGGSTGTPPLDLHQLTASIQSQVQQQIRSVYGQDPSPDELKSWTQFIISQGMKLQQGGPRKSLSPDAALSEAEAQAARQITNSPQGRTWISNQQENTTLHDALVSAISATRGLA